MNADSVSPTDSALPAWASLCERITRMPAFRRSVLWVIALASLLVGLETYEWFTDAAGPMVHLANTIIIVVFVIELVIRMGAFGYRPDRFFLDPWNVFDFLIVVLCLLPVGAEFAAVARLARVLRVMRLISAVPRLQIIVTALFNAIPSIVYVIVLLILLFYVYGVIGTSLFGANDPWHFGDLHRSMLSLFRVITLEDWTDIMYIQMYGSAAYTEWNGYPTASIDPGVIAESRAMPVVGALYFVSFVLLGTMIAMNFFVGVVLSSLDEAQRDKAEALLESTDPDRDADDDGGLDLDAELKRISSELGSLNDRMTELLAIRAKQDRGGEA